MTGPAEDLDALRAGGKAALARALTALETRGDAPDVARLLDAAHAAPRGLVIGLTGPPGVGKSTLTNALIARLRGAGRTVGVIAVDPSSRRGRGALLGDRTRIEADPEDAGVFVRSMAARDRLGGLAALTFPSVVLMRALFDRVLVETVGVGQSEAEISDTADLVVFCAQPGAGDALQFMKAGVTELPDIVLVTKGDLGPVAERAAADVRGALSLAAGPEAPAPVLVVSALSGAGLDAAIEAIEVHGAALAQAGALAERRARQTRVWAEERLTRAFGREGCAILGGVAGSSASPFAASAAELARLRGLLEQARQTA